MRMRIQGLRFSGLEFSGIKFSRLDLSGIEFSELGLKFSGIEFNRLEVRGPKFSGIEPDEPGSADLISAVSSSENSSSVSETEQIYFFGDPSSMLRECKTWISGSPGRQEEVWGFPEPESRQTGSGRRFARLPPVSSGPPPNRGLHRMQNLSAGTRPRPGDELKCSK